MTPLVLLTAVLVSFPVFAVNDCNAAIKDKAGFCALSKPERVQEKPCKQYVLIEGFRACADADDPAPATTQPPATHFFPDGSVGSPRVPASPAPSRPR